MSDSYAKKTQSSKPRLVYLVSGKAAGKDAWYYVKVDEPKNKAFNKQMESGALDLADYGKVLFSGWGTVPPEPIQALVQEESNAA